MRSWLKKEERKENSIPFFLMLDALPSPGEILNVSRVNQWIQEVPKLSKELKRELGIEVSWRKGIKFG